MNPDSPLVILRRLDQIDFYDLGSRDSPLSLVSHGQPPVVGHVVIECRRGRELQQLNLQRLPVRAGAPHTLKHPAAVLGKQIQNPVLVGDQGALSARPRP